MRGRRTDVWQQRRCMPKISSIGNRNSYYNITMATNKEKEDWEVTSGRQKGIDLVVVDVADMNCQDKA